MSGAANPVRGEAALAVAGETLVLRPSFAALVAAEAELGPLFALVERAADGKLSLAEMVALFWHCLRDPPEGLDRIALGEAVLAGEADLHALNRRSLAWRGKLRQTA